MKKTIALVLSLMLVLAALVGCSGNRGNNNKVINNLTKCYDLLADVEEYAAENKLDDEAFKNDAASIRASLEEVQGVVDKIIDEENGFNEEEAAALIDTLKTVQGALKDMLDTMEDQVENAGATPAPEATAEATAEAEATPEAEATAEATAEAVANS
ncbi:MAG: hypothetical protein IJF80_02200 [Clostridia bacterium]|nr:hypothetical protein [Clostridia bacterium]